MSGRRSRSRVDDAVEFVVDVGNSGQIALVRIAVAKRGSAKIMTPAADWIRWAQVREPTTRKNAS